MITLPGRCFWYELIKPSFPWSGNWGELIDHIKKEIIRMNKMTMMVMLCVQITDVQLILVMHRVYVHEWRFFAVLFNCIAIRSAPSPPTTPKQNRPNHVFIFHLFVCFPLSFPSHQVFCKSSTCYCMQLIFYTTIWKEEERRKMQLRWNFKTKSYLLSLPSIQTHQ